MTAFISPPPRLQFFTNAGVPMASGLLYTYAAGTTTPLVTYTDSTGLVANTNPVILDSRGEASIWLGGVGYKFKLATPANVDVWTQDNVSNDVSSANMIYTPAGTGAVTTTVQAKLRESVSVKDFGAVGDGVTDDTAAIQAAITACIANTKSLYIPKANYVLAGQLTVGTPVDIRSDRNATMRWTTASSGSVGIVLDFDSGGDNLCSIELPCLFSPAINSSFQIPNYSAAASYNYNLASRIGNAIYLKGGNRINLSAQYICGFTNGLLAEATTTTTCDNINFTVNTMDFCEKGINLLSGSASAKGFSQFVFNANTVWAKFPIYFDLTYGYVVSSRFTIAGGAFVNEDGGCGVYCVGGTNFTDNVVDINFLEAGARSDSVPATTVGLVCPYLGGNATSNALSYDGMGTSPNIGYFGGKRSELFFGTYYGSISADLGSASPTPTAGKTIRIRDGGTGNRVRVRYADFANTSAAPIASSATVGEANYNSGVGGAQYGRAIYSSSTINILAGATVTHYIYHQCTSPLGFRPYAIVPRDSGVGSNQLSISAFPTGTTNREIQIYIRNNSAATFNSTVNYWLIVE